MNDPNEDDVSKEIPPLGTPEVIYYDDILPSQIQNQVDLPDDFELQFPLHTYAKSDVTTSPYIIRPSVSPSSRSSSPSSRRSPRKRSPSPRRSRSPSLSRSRSPSPRRRKSQRNRSRSLEIRHSRRRSPVRRSRSASFSSSASSSSSPSNINRRGTQRPIRRRPMRKRRGYVLGSRTVRVGPNRLLHKYGNHSITFVTEGGAHIRNKKIPNKACRYLLSHCSRRHPTARDRLPRQARIVLRKKRA